MVEKIENITNDYKASIMRLADAIDTLKAEHEQFGFWLHVYEYKNREK